MSQSPGFHLDSGPVVVVGAGAAGTVVARALDDAGVHVNQILSRNVESARRLARSVGAESASDRLDELFDRPGLVALAVPDAQVAGLSEELATLPRSWAGCIVLHLSGTLPSEVLAPLRGLGADVMSFHPMRSLHVDTPAEVLRGAWINIEGTDTAIEVGRHLAHRLGAHPFIVDAKTKSAIHVAASVASNFLVTLMTVAADLLAAAGISPEDRDGLLRRLVVGTIDNVDFGDPCDALTGPISRADRSTLAAQLEVLGRLRPEYSTIFAGLAAETVQMAVRGGKIDALEASELLDLLKEHVESNVSGR